MNHILKKGEINNKSLENNQVRPIAPLLDDLDFLLNEEYESE